MTINLYLCQDDPRKMDKTLTNESVCSTATMREDVDISSPIIRVQQSVLLQEHNYLKIPAFNRYYYIKDIVIERTGLSVLYCKTDVLMTFKDSIKTCPAIAARSQNIVTAFVPDGRQPANAFRISTVKKFAPFTFIEPSIIMLTVG